MSRREQDEIIGKIVKLSPNQLRLAHDFIAALLHDEVENGHEQPPNDGPDAIPQWAERTTGREVTPVDWIKMHYGRMIDGEWNRDGLTLADIGRVDQKLYDAYYARVKRLPEESLGLPVEPRAKVADPEKALEMKRRASRNWMRRKRAKEPKISL